MTSSMAIDKVMTKRVWLAEGLPTPRYALLHRGQFTREDVRTIPDDLGLPLIVKPVREGSSLGVTRSWAIRRCRMRWPPQPRSMPTSCASSSSPATK
jgi:D-alanine-D-alanine ligase-like ATP-grasp enzyme